MPRASKNQVRVYRETIFPLIEGKKMSKQDFSELTGHNKTYINTILSPGYRDVSRAQVMLWANILGVTDDDITAIPKYKEEPKPYTTTAYAVDAESVQEIVAKAVNDNAAELTGLITDGFRMLHQDIQLLIETMDRYWKPTEPKYEIVEREQP